MLRLILCQVIDKQIPVSRVVPPTVSLARTVGSHNLQKNWQGIISYENISYFQETDKQLIFSSSPPETFPSLSLSWSNTRRKMTKEKRFLSQVSRCEERRTEWKWKCLFWFNQAMISCSFFFFFFSYMSDHKAYIYDSFVCLMCKHKHTNLTSFPSSSLSSPDACPSGSFLG